MIPLKPYYEDQFYGMDRRLDSDKLGNGFSPLAVNVDLDRLGTVRKRKGTSLLGNHGEKDSPVQTLIEYVTNAGDTEIHMARNGTLYKYNKDTNAWDVLSAAKFASLKPVESVLYKNRVYHVSTEESLCWNVGDKTVVEVGEGANKIKGACLGTGQRTLYIGRVTIDGVDYPDRVYYSLFDIDKGQEGDQFWNDAEGEEVGSLKNSTRWFRVEGGIVQSIVSFPNKNKVFIFSDTKCYSFDVSQVESSPFNALTEVFQIGCAGPRAATVVDGVMYWMDKQAKIWAWSGIGSRPEEISYLIDDENLGDSVISQISKSPENLNQVAAFGLGKRVYFNIGSINLDRVSLPNAAIKLSASQNGLRANFSIDTFQDRLILGTVITLNGAKVLAVGNSSNVLLLNSGYNDIDKLNIEAPVDSFYRTKSYHYGYPLQNKKIMSLYVKFKPQVNEQSYLNIKVSVNGDLDFTSLSTPTAEELGHGTIDMYDDSADRLKQKTKKVNMKAELKGQTLAFEFGNNQLNQTYEVSTFGFLKAEVEDANIPVS
jgi:hypothetical protein